MSDKNVQATLDQLTIRIKEIQQSLQEFLKKLELQERLEWPSVLDSFAVLSSQFNILLSSLKNERTPLLRNQVLLPIHLSLDIDPQLQQLTENRISVWNHAVAPDYLRTKPDPRIEQIEKDLANVFSSRAPEQVQKQITSMNKCMTNIIDNVQNSSSASENSYGKGGKIPATFNNDDTKKLIVAISRGKHIEPSPPQAPGGGKYVSSGKASAKQAAAAHPYAR